MKIPRIAIINFSVQIIFVLTLIIVYFGKPKKKDKVRKPTPSIQKLPPYTNLTIWGYDSITGKDWMTCIVAGDTTKPLIIEGWGEIL